MTSGIVSLNWRKMFCCEAVFLNRKKFSKPSHENSLNRAFKGINRMRPFVRKEAERNAVPLKK